ncbi:MAG: hybrid sensor histidine kinase/response regulator [Lachnospiraceae bacterium]|nr:hybrid sensor histidine kinase/response regulator [Lachnospiraceae bacterium]
MNQRKTENFIILLVSFGCISLTLESLLLHWEFWVPPLLIAGAILLWAMNLTGKPSFPVRKGNYLLFAILAVFYHGVHETSYFDVSIVIVLMMVAYSFFDARFMVNIFLAEYGIIMCIQFMLAMSNPEEIFTPLNISRLLLHVAIVIMIYFVCIKLIDDRAETEEIHRKKDEQIEYYNADMEDFLTNISHELRTPVNVVNGMSDVLIKKNGGKEARSIKDAGIRLAYQIEDIQDFTECKREKVMLEEEDYMSTSLVNDVVTSFRMMENAENLELVVDLDPSVPTAMRGDIKKLHKIFRHLLENAVKFTRKGGIYIRLFTEEMDYGANLCIEMTDTGIGMDRKAILAVSEGMYQVNKRRNRSSGGIGLGLFIVYGFAHRMGGFVKIESEKGNGTTVRVTIPQRVADAHPCLAIDGNFTGDILFHVRSGKYKVPKVRDFYRYMATHVARGIRVPLYSAETVQEIERLREKLNVTFIFMGQEEYEANPSYFDELSKGDMVVAVSAYAGFHPTPGSCVITMPKPLYGYPVVKILNEGKAAKNIEYADRFVKPVFRNLKALIVDDEPMNLVVATSLFADYHMDIDTAASGQESIRKFCDGDYDVVFMDHMMPEMDGVEAMKLIKEAATDLGKKAVVVALTANSVSGAREMFMKEGFDGFIAKPINLSDFERVMLQVLPESKIDRGGEQ